MLTLNEAPRLCGEGLTVQTPHGRVRYLDLDKAATTPPFESVLEAVTRFMGRYGSVHRGAGDKSRWSTAVFERSVSEILDFVGAPASSYSLALAANTTGAVNKLVRLLKVGPDDAVLLSEFEHSSNDLPWRRAGRLVRIAADEAGAFDLGRFEEALKTTVVRGRKFVAVTGASNITGALTPLGEIADLAHAHGALLAVDAAQLVAHRPVDMAASGADFLAFAGHKMYAPFGCGVLVGRREFMSEAEPDDLGGGNVAFGSAESYALHADPFRRMTAGTPNAVGALAVALAGRRLRGSISFEAVVEHERAILSRAAEVLPALNGLRTYGEMGYDAGRKCAVLPFNLTGVPAGLVAARLGHEFGIGVRSGVMCQFGFVARLMGVAPEAVEAARKEALAGRGSSYGLVRASFGLGNVPEDVDRLAQALKRIRATPEGASDYRVDEKGAWVPRRSDAPDLDGLFQD